MQTSVRFASVNGALVPYPEATVHIQSPAFRYGASLFDVIRGYWNETDACLYLFRLGAHLRRLAQSARLAAYDGILDVRATEGQIVELIRANALREDVDVRVNLFIGGFGPVEATGPVETGIVAMPARNLFGVPSGGLRCAVSAWRRIADDAMPPRIKAAANYQNSRLALAQAKRDGYDSVILLNRFGQVAEGPGANIFVSRDGRVATPPVTAGILEGITRATVGQLLLEECGLAMDERPVDRTELYLADEAFFCGTGAEIRPIVSIDQRPIGNGEEGPLTARVRETYLGIARGRLSRHREWLTPVALEDAVEAR